MTVCHFHAMKSRNVGLTLRLSYIQTTETKKKHHEKTLIHSNFIQTNSPGDIIHLLGYYPEPPTTERPRPVYKPIYTYPKPTSTMNHHATLPVRPSWDHETNHIGSPSYHPLVHPDDHFGLDDGPDDHNHHHNSINNNNEYAVNEASSFTHHTYDEFDHNNNNKPSHHPHISTFNEANIDDDDEDEHLHHHHEYRPIPGTKKQYLYNSHKNTYILS